MSPQGYKHLVKVPTRIAERQAIIPGDYVVIQPGKTGERYVAEVVLVIDDEYERFYRDVCLWPKEYDVPNLVERLAEKRERARAAEEEEEKYKKLCGPVETKQKKPKKEKKKSDKCKTSKKYEDECLKSAPIFADDFLPLKYYDDEPWRKNLASCATDTAKPTNCGTNTGQAKSCVSSGCSSGASNCFTKSSCDATTQCCCSNTNTNTKQKKTASTCSSFLNNSGCSKSSCGGKVKYVTNTTNAINTGQQKTCVTSDCSFSSSGCCTVTTCTEHSCFVKKICVTRPSKSNNMGQKKICATSDCSSRASGCCTKTCCGGNIQTRNVGIGYHYTDVVASRSVISCPHYMENVCRGESPRTN